MDNYGITDKGFIRPLYNDILKKKFKKARETFGVNIDLAETSFLGQLLRLSAYDEAIIWEEVEKVYYSAFVNSSEGTSLDNVGMYLTISRRPATNAVGLVTIYGEDDTIIPKGFRIATKKGIVYETVEEAKIDLGRASVKVQSIGRGKSFNVGVGELSEIISPVVGIKSVTNESETDGGLDIETDEEFRDRYKKSYSRAGGSTTPALTSALLDIDGVVDAYVIENVTMKTVDGIPPKSFECFIYGGDEEDIVDAIYKNKSAGIESFGQIKKEVKDEQGMIHTIGFTRAKPKYIWVRIKVKKDKDYKGDEALKRYIINYIGGVDADGIKYNGLKLGRDVIFTKITSLGMCLGGIVDLSAEVSTDGEVWKRENIEVLRNEIARTSMDRLEIIYV